MARAKRRKRIHRPHKPTQIGPRTFLRGRWQWIDLRPFGGKREAIRNPSHPNWPDAGDKTTDAETAQRWSWKYLDHLRGDTKRRHLGLKGPSKPLGAEVLRFLEHRERTASVKTYVNNSAALKVQLVPFLGADLAVDTVDRDAMQRWADHLLTQRYEISTVRNYLAIARRFFRWRSKKQHDPTVEVELPDKGKRDVEPWTDVELKRLRAAADTLDRTQRDDRERPALRSYRLLLECALATGCRVAELGALDWSAFDEDERTVRVRWQVPPDGYGSSLQPLKGRRNRTALVLPSWWDFHDSSAAGRVVLAPNVETISHRALERWFGNMIDKAGVKRPMQNAHTSRHTYARISLESGARLEELKEFLGHRSIRTTEDFYGHLSEQSATTLARSRIYGSGLQLVKPKRREGRRAAG